MPPVRRRREEPRLSTLWLQPPGPDADERVRLTFIRDLCARVALVSAPVVLLAVAMDAGVATAVVLAGFVLQLANLAWLQLKLRRV